MDIQINLAMRDVIARVKTAGLHEVAKREHKLEDLTAKHAAAILGAELLKIAGKYEAVRSGLASLDEVSGDLDLPTVKTASGLRRALFGPSTAEKLQTAATLTGLTGATGAGMGALGGGLVGGLTGAIDPDSTAGEGALRGALYGGGIGGGLGAGSAVLPLATKGMGAPIGGLMLGAIPLAAGTAGLASGLDTTGRRERSREAEAKRRENEAAKTASMFDLKQLKSLLPAGEDAAHAASGALPELAGAGGSAGHSGMFSQFDLPAVNPKQGIRGGLSVDPRAIPAEMPNIRPLPKLGHWLKLAGPPPIPAAVKTKSMADAAAKKLFSMDQGVGHLFGGAGPAAARPAAAVPKIMAPGNDPLSLQLRNSGTQMQQGLGQLFGKSTLTADDFGRMKQLEEKGRMMRAAAGG